MPSWVLVRSQWRGHSLRMRQELVLKDRITQVERPGGHIDALADRLLPYGQPSFKVPRMPVKGHHSLQ